MTKYFVEANTVAQIRNLLQDKLLGVVNDIMDESVQAAQSCGAYVDLETYTRLCAKADTLEGANKKLNERIMAITNMVPSKQDELEYEVGQLKEEIEAWKRMEGVAEDERQDAIRKAIDAKRDSEILREQIAGEQKDKAELLLEIKERNDKIRLLTAAVFGPDDPASTQERLSMEGKYWREKDARERAERDKAEDEERIHELNDALNDALESNETKDAKIQELEEALEIQGVMLVARDEKIERLNGIKDDIEILKEAKENGSMVSGLVKRVYALQSQARELIAEKAAMEEKLTELQLKLFNSRKAHSEIKKGSTDIEHRSVAVLEANHKLFDQLQECKRKCESFESSYTQMYDLLQAEIARGDNLSAENENLRARLDLKGEGWV